ncbi:hypothetical protein E2K93_16770 [Thalassotalea sp. HSM 43]|nr:hypothetical protein E2K93_16770 [Thalassotalea sp. HSM 43]
MNFTVALKILLVVSIVLQSFTTVVSATSQSHQVDVEHLQTQHDHQDDLNTFNDNTRDEHHDVNDCHHCGHCSGTHMSWILVNNLISDIKLYNFNQPPYQFSQTDEILSIILRPPIS